MTPLPSLTPYAAVALVAAALASAGAWQAQEWRYGAKEAQRLQREREADELRQADVRQAREMNDKAAGLHAAALAHVNTQLGAANAQIALLSDGRACLDGRTVGLLNNIGKPAGGLGLRAAAGDPAGPAPAAAGSGADAAPAGYASERATAAQIAACRAQYAEVASQVNQILDAEEQRDAQRASR
ncbi:hypothetical protein [Paracidovorax wautersii]|uniref:Bacteriophage Rz lysis protein n=1 Tax=Paracidovorax wautersii TaxID=1177982 RepID=A0A1I2FI46_9BURK|nr:hypothetical protein [Paracidovorax wautersii]SFF05164.1 hypothetical protein SAMN04489711_1117 [Paracidovorax wautersii]